MYSYLSSEMYMRALMDRIDFPQLVFWLLVVSIVLAVTLALTGIYWAVNSLLDEYIDLDEDWSRRMARKRRPHVWTPIHHN